MRIEDIDPNLKIETDIEEPDLVWLDAKSAAFSLYGVSYDEEKGCYVRLPVEIAEAVSTRVAGLNYHTSGGRLRFRTNSSFIGIRVVRNPRIPMGHMALCGQSGFDLYRESEKGEIHYKTFVPPHDQTDGYSSPFKTDGVERDYTLNFPLYDGVQELYIALKKDALLKPAAPYANNLPVVFYGSSITQGGCASRPGTLYQGHLSRWLNMDYYNLGFSGACRAEDAMADYINSLKMKAFVYDFDHNSPNYDFLKEHHLPFFRKIRAAHPDLPILMVSAPDAKIHGGSWMDRRDLIRNNYELLKSEGDENLWYVDGSAMFDGDVELECTVDGTHPTDLGFYFMARAMRPALEEMLKK